MNVFFFDDDENNIKTIKTIGQKMSARNVVFNINVTFSDLVSATQCDNETIVFIDTRLTEPDGGFALAKLIRGYSSGCHIIFMSSHIEDIGFCLQNLLRPTAFLLKPLNKAEVIEIINEISEENKRQKNKSNEKLFISTHEIKKTIKTDNVLYFTTSGKKILCKMTDGENIEFYSTIKELENKYSDSFIRCHSGYLVNKNMIAEFSKGMLVIKNNRETLPVSKKYKSGVMSFLKNPV